MSNTLLFIINPLASNYEVSALGLVYQLMLKRQARWRRLNYPELASAVIAGVKYRNGIEIRTRKEIA